MQLRNYIPSTEEITALCASANPHAKFAIIFAVLTGLRSAEQCALAWGDIDFDDRLIKVIPHEGVKGRVVPISAQLAGLLTEHRVQSGAEAQDLVFTSRQGEALTAGYMRTRYFQPTWSRAATAWNGDTIYTAYTWAALRQFAISSWLKEGLGYKHVGSFGGIQVAPHVFDKLLDPFPRRGFEMMDRLAQDLLPKAQ